jgi:pimeloyl-ACP methyl ester carboxylesterase
MTQTLVTSADGTKISVEHSGVGRPLVVVSGALFASELWLKAVPLILHRRAVVVDRRGRGKSGNGPVYSPEREVEDLLAVLASLDGPVDLLGHSSGALLALQAAQRTPRI